MVESYAIIDYIPSWRPLPGQLTLTLGQHNCRAAVDENAVKNLKWNRYEESCRCPLRRSNDIPVGISIIGAGKTDLAGPLPSIAAVSAALQRTLGYDPKITWTVHSVRPSVISNMAEASFFDCRLTLGSFNPRTALTFNYPFITNFAYNADREAVSSFSDRRHAEF